MLARGEWLESDNENKSGSSSLGSVLMCEQTSGPREKMYVILFAEDTGRSEFGAFNKQTRGTGYIGFLEALSEDNRDDV